jgi:predicted nuclease of predicted toxin-antitoxin system
MNLTPEWVTFLAQHGIAAEHWVKFGSPTASDAEIMEFARASGYVVFTHDLDFGNLLAATNARGPSVVQVRTQEPTPSAIGPVIVAALRDLRIQLERGALVTIDASSLRSRVLPLFRRG